VQNRVERLSVLLDAIAATQGFFVSPACYTGLIFFGSLRPQSSSASRFTTGCTGFLILSQSGERPAANYDKRRPHAGPKTLGAPEGPLDLRAPLPLPTIPQVEEQQEHVCTLWLAWGAGP
jgi:hypothetical protein